MFVLMTIGEFFEKLFNLNGLIAKGIKEIENILEFSPILLIKDTFFVNFFNIVVFIILICAIIKKKEVVELFFS